MKLYAISGLGADERVFKYLTLNCELVPLKWIMPQKNETIESYSNKFVRKINQNTNEKMGILGVSFGGLVAVEMSKKMNPALTILISSAETTSELRPIYNIIGKLQLVKFIPEKLFIPPKFASNYLFGAKEKELLHQILADTDSKFAKWAINALLNWKNTQKLNNKTLKISGTKDKLMPPSKDSTLIQNGTHFMIVDSAKEISQIINEELRKVN
ncbi:MAG: hypothetical protein R2798_07770 [Chitinophagales bacterium]|nr:alpha/beta hydrolase [Bacteroidota bacterium]MCB9042333.1 alpha/beta hydrolase [Chitinophagales bacterium]